MNLRATSLWMLLCIGAAGQETARQDWGKLEVESIERAPHIPAEPIGNKLFYYPTQNGPATPATWGFRYRQIKFQSKDGTNLHGWMIAPHHNKSKGTVVFSHGNAGSIGYHLGFVMWLAKAGYQVMMYDYRGYGKSAGKAGRQGMIEDARAAIAYATNEAATTKTPVISYGHSIGGVKSVAAIARAKPAGLKVVVIDAAFASYREMARLIGGRLAEELVTDDMAPVKLIAEISPLPLLVIHGRKDPVVPFSQGLKLFKAAAQPKTLFEVKEGMHGDCLSRDKGAYRKQMLDWLDKQLEQS